MIEIKKGIATGKSRCRGCSSPYQKNNIPRGQDIVIINTWAPNGYVQIFLCMKHAYQMQEELKEIVDSLWVIEL